MKNFLMTRKEVCKYLGISVSRLRRLEESGRLQAVRCLEGGKKLYSSADVYAHMQSIWTGGEIQYGQIGMIADKQDEGHG